MSEDQDVASGGIVLSPAQLKERKKKNIAIALALVFFVALIFWTTIIRIQSNIDMGMS